MLGRQQQWVTLPLFLTGTLALLAWYGKEAESIGKSP
jgi:hypothetical protein